MSTDTVDASKRKKIELILHQLSTLPTLPAVAVQLLQITVKSDTQAAEVVRLIESDPSLSSKIIALASRADIGIRRDSVSVNKAVVLLGFEAVRNMALTIKVFETFSRESQAGEEVFDRTAFWKHSLAVACAARMLSLHIDPHIDAEEAFVCGLLHDLGKIALDTCLPKSFARVVAVTESSLGNIMQVEQKILGIDHTVAGRRIAQKWRLPDSIIESVWLHHHDPLALPEAVENRNLVKTVYLANILARELRIGYSGNHQMNTPAREVAERLGCPANTVDTIARELPALVADRAELLGLDNVEPEQLYHEALGSANGELSRLNRALIEQNRRLSIRSSYFDLLGKFNDGLQEYSSTAEVCSFVAELWQKHCKTPHCAVYVTSAADTIYEGAWRAADDGNLFVVDRSAGQADFENELPEFDASATERPALVTSEQTFAVNAVTPEHSWFFEHVAPEMNFVQTLVVPLRIGQRTVGELIWQDDRAPKVFQDQMQELQAFVGAAALALLEKQKQEQQDKICEQLAQANQQLEESQRELMQSRMMSMIGEMACGAAHEINNPLAVIVGRAQLLAAGEADEKKRQTLETIARQGQDATTIITELLEFAQPASPKPILVGVADLISRAVADKAEYARQAQVTLETDLEEDLPDIQVDDGQVVAALAELIDNAVASYQGRPGLVSVHSRLNSLDHELVLEVVDQGCGMDAEEQRKAFDPFYSSRPAGRNRGLGLSRSCRQIESNGGRLQLISRTGEGTTARVVLPLARVNSVAESY